MKFVLLLIGLQFTSMARAACPGTAKDFAKDGPKILLKIANQKKIPGVAEVGSKKADSGVSEFKVGNEKMFLVQLGSMNTAVLNGVFRCDGHEGNVQLLAFSWTSTKGSGVGGGE